MSESSTVSNGKLFKTPFCKAYWRAAAAEFKNLRMLLFAALVVALRVALKSVSIPIAADLRIGVGFLVNALGSMVYGPVVAIAGAAISDTLGALLFPSGPYFPLFLITEIAGSLIFALFLYRAEVTTLRVILSRFCIDFFVNIVLQTPIMMAYYKIMMGQSYMVFNLPRIVKNLVMFPIESVLLTIFLRFAIPPLYHSGYVYSNADHLRFTRRHVALLAALFLVGAAATAGYAVYDYNTKSLSASYTAEERLRKNTLMTQWVADENPDLDLDSLVVVIESAYSKVGNPNADYTLAVYTVNAEKFNERQAADEAFSLDSLRGLSKSKAAKEDALQRIGSGQAVANKRTDERVSLTCTFD